MIIEEGLIAIGILALIAALFLLRGKAKTSDTSQQAKPKQVADKQAVTLAGPSASAKTQSAPLSTSQVPSPVSAADKQPTVFAEPLTSAKTQVAFSVPQVPFPVSTANKQSAIPAQPSGSAKTQPSFPVPQIPFPVPAGDKQTVALAELDGSTKTPTLTETSFQVHTTPVRQTPVQQAASEPIHASVAANEQLTVKSDKAFSEMHTPIPASIVPLPRMHPVSRSLSHPPSVDQQIAELIADTWALQQQAAEIGRRLNYLSACIQHSTAPALDERNTNSKG